MSLLTSPSTASLASVVSKQKRQWQLLCQPPLAPRPRVLHLIFGRRYHARLVPHVALGSPDCVGHYVLPIHSALKEVRLFVENTSVQCLVHGWQGVFEVRGRWSSTETRQLLMMFGSHSVSFPFSQLQFGRFQSLTCYAVACRQRKHEKHEKHAKTSRYQSIPGHTRRDEKPTRAAERAVSACDGHLIIQHGGEDGEERGVSSSSTSSTSC